VLVLSRRLNEKVVLPDLGVTIQVVAIQGGLVRIGIAAPPEVRIVREELRLTVRPKNGDLAVVRTANGVSRTRHSHQGK
jgi:carbon storage regulator CsrA